MKSRADDPEQSAAQNHDGEPRTSSEDAETETIERAETETMALKNALAVELAGMTRLYELSTRKYQQELQEVTTRLIEAQETQSKHLARELHDVFSQRLAAIGMELARLADAAPSSGQSFGGQLRKLTEQIGALAKDIHGISRQIHPAILDDLGLAAAIRSECLAFSEQYGMSTEFTADKIPWEIPEDVALCLYRIAQESLRNIGKHAGVSQVSVRLKSRPGQLILAIDDAGHGFDPETIKGKRGLGLVSMEERLRIVGGTLSLRSRQGSGTHVVAQVPIAP